MGHHHRHHPGTIAALLNDPRTDNDTFGNLQPAPMTRGTNTKISPAAADEFAAGRGAAPSPHGHHVSLELTACAPGPAPSSWLTARARAVPPLQRPPLTGSASLVAASLAGASLVGR